MRLGRAEAALRRLFQAFEADGLEITVDGAAEEAWSFGFLVDDLPQRFDGRVGIERRPAGQQLVEDDAKAVDVDTRRQSAAAEGLLWRHVARRADQRTRWRQGRQAAEAAARRRGQGQTFRQAEVGDVRLIVPIEENVAGLQIAVQDAALVGVVHSASHAGDHAGDLHLAILRPLAGGVRRPQPELADSPRQAARLDQLHGQKVLAIVLADVVDRHDVGMIEMGGCLGLAAQTLDVGRRMPSGHAGSS